MAVFIFIISFVLGFFGGWILRGRNIKIKQSQISLTDDTTQTQMIIKT